MSLLADRLKFAKRELTALKTAHTRGLGNLKVYTLKATVPPDGPGSGIYTFVATIHFDTKFTPYPFVSLLPTIMPSTLLYATQAIGFNYTADGFGAKMKIVNLPGIGSNDFVFVSTAPITSIEYEWINNE